MVVRCFIITGRVGDKILDSSGLLFVLATLLAFCWIMYVMFCLMVSMSSSSNSVFNWFLNSRWNSIFNLLLNIIVLLSFPC